MKIAVMFAALVLAAAPLHAEILDREQVRRDNYVALNPEAAVESTALFVKAGAWPANKIVIPGKGADSVLVKILQGTVKPQMPLRAPVWAPDKIALVKAWIDSGATEAGFTKDVQPLFKQSCAGCHSPASHAAGLILDTLGNFQTSVVGH